MMMRPYPWKCAECRQKAVKPATISHTAQIKHDGATHQVAVAELPVHRCENCKAVVLGEDADFAIRAKLREDLDLLQPDQIRAGRKALGLSQDQLGELLGLAGESICRWERGVIQSQASNKLLCAFFDLPEFREYVGGVHLTALPVGKRNVR